MYSYTSTPPPPDVYDTAQAIFENHWNMKDENNKNINSKIKKK